MAARRTQRIRRSDLIVTPDQHSQLKRLFLEACELAPERQREFVEAHCPEGEMRHRLRVLLSFDDGFHESLAGEPGSARLGAARPPLGPDLEAGDTVGPYRIVRAVGEGGMGTVYLAEQERPIRRAVALKVVKLGMDTRQVVARFESERQALALMEHPGIAKVYEAGATDTGRPYFAMEFVDGEPVTDYADRKGLDIDQRVRLLIEVAGAVQHAHQKGVIHRDLKPSNVLVSERDGAPAIKVIDFGVAKAAGAQLSEHTLQTIEGQFLGTPAYMSPEQAAGRVEDIDTRTDVFALGVLLYELLVGAPPFDPDTWRTASVAELQRRIAGLEPPRPTTRLAALDADTAAAAARNRGRTIGALARSLKGDLEWIALRALEHDRDRRYASASELAAELDRYLRSEPVLAGPPGALYRTGKFIRRHRVGVAAATLVGAALILGVAGLSAGLLRAQRAETRAVERQAEAERQAAIAGEVNAFLNDMLAEANPRNNTGAIDLTVRETLDQAAEKIDGRFDGEPEVEAALRKTIGWTYSNLGVYDEAERNLTRAIELYKSSNGLESITTQDAMNAYALMLIDMQRYDEAEATLLEKLDAEQRTEPFDEAEHSVTLNNLGLVNLYMRNGAAAQEYLERCLEIRRRLLTPPDEKIAVTMHNLGAAKFVQGDFEGAIPVVREAYEMRLETLPEDHPDLSQSLNTLAYLYDQTDRVEQAEELFREALALRQRIYGDDHPAVAQAKNNLATLLNRAGRPAEAVPLLREAIDTWQRALGPAHLFVRRAMGTLAAALEATGHAEEGAAILASRVERTRAADGVPAEELAAVLAELARARSDLGRYEDAEAPLLEAVALDPTLRPAVARLYDEWGRPDQAAAWRADEDPPATGDS
jgi:serine/threonine protein kinase